MLRIVFGFAVTVFLFAGCTFQLDGLKATDTDTEITLDHVEGSAKTE